MRRIKAWFNRQNYEWHLNKMERLHELPMVGEKDRFELIRRHAAALLHLTAPTDKGRD